MKIGVYASARNEEANLSDWLDSTTGADCVYVNDTGSTDNTYALLQADERVHATQLPVVPMQLSNALNIALARVPDDIDLCIRLDLDERLQPGWREALEEVWSAVLGIEDDDVATVQRPRPPRTFRDRGDDEVVGKSSAVVPGAGTHATHGPIVLQLWFDHMGLTYRHDRIHSRHGFRWDLPVHEILVCDGPYQRVPVEVTIEHHQDPTKDRSQVLGELQAAYEADPENLRLIHYLGREYTYRADWGNAIPLLRAHAESDAFPEERAESWRLLGNSYISLMAIEDVPLRPFRIAAETCPERREGWVCYSDLCRQQDRWLESLEAAERALTITEPHWYGNLPFAWGGEPSHLAALACWNLNRYEDAARYGRRAVELEPDNDLYRSNLVFYEGALTSV